MTTRVPKKQSRTVTECPLYGISPLALANTFHLDIDTATVWKARLRTNPVEAQRVALLVSGDLGAWEPRLLGFRVAQGTLWTPEGMPVDPGELRSIPIRIQQLGEYARAQRWMIEASTDNQRREKICSDVAALLHLATEALRQR